VRLQPALLDKLKTGDNRLDEDLRCKLLRDDGWGEERSGASGEDGVEVRLK